MPGNVLKLVIACTIRRPEGLRSRALRASTCMPWIACLRKTPSIYPDIRIAGLGPADRHPVFRGKGLPLLAEYPQDLCPLVATVSTVPEEQASCRTLHRRCQGIPDLSRSAVPCCRVHPEPSLQFPFVSLPPRFEAGIRRIARRPACQKVAVRPDGALAPGD